MPNRHEVNDFGRGVARLNSGGSLRGSNNGAAGYDHRSYDHYEDEEAERDPGGRHPSHYHQDNFYHHHQRYRHEPSSSSSASPYAASPPYSHPGREQARMPPSNYPGSHYPEAASYQYETPRITDPRHYGDRSNIPTSYYNDSTKATGARYHHSTHSDMPSLVESETSSYENSWNEEDWNSKKSPSENYYYGGRGYAERESDATSSKMTYREKASWQKSVEISPGQYLRLRGADETWKAIQNDFYMPTECSCCRLTIFCIQDADFVLCPECRVVSPLAGVVYEGSDGGVGLGFTMKELAGWQKDIEMNRRAARKQYDG